MTGILKVARTGAGQTGIILENNFSADDIEKNRFDSVPSVPPANGVR